MDYLVVFTEMREPVHNYLISDCPSELVALSEARIHLYRDEKINTWVEEERDRSITIIYKGNFLEEEESEDEGE